MTQNERKFEFFFFSDCGNWPKAAFTLKEENPFGSLATEHNKGQTSEQILSF